jgi:hypothetical protein
MTKRVNSTHFRLLAAAAMVWGSSLAVSGSPIAGAAQDAPAASPDGTRTIWSGVYTEAQAKRGEEVFRQKCAYCHRNDLSGGDEGRPLRGTSFLIRWDGPISNLFFKIGNTMPQTAPATLEPAAVVDILGLILKVNGAPAGDMELVPSETLEKILITKE